MLIRGPTSPYWKSDIGIVQNVAALVSFNASGASLMFFKDLACICLPFFQHLQ